MKKFFLCFISLIFIFSFPLYIFASNFDYTWSCLSPTLSTSANVSEENTNNSSNPLGLECGSCILIEQTTGRVLYSYNSHKPQMPASVTKLMSIYLIMEAISSNKINYNTKIPCSKNAESMGGSQIWLTTTEELTVDEMLKAICVVSANDCVTALRRIFRWL